MSLHRWRKKKLIVIHSYAFISTTVDKTLLGLTVSQKHTHNRSAFIWDYTGRPVPEETFTHSHPSWLSHPLSDTAGQLVDVVGRWVCKTVGRAHVSKRRHGAWQGDAIAANRTQTPDTGDPGPPSDVAGWSADISVVFLVPYRGRLKRLHVHCRAGCN